MISGCPGRSITYDYGLCTDAWKTTPFAVNAMRSEAMAAQGCPGRSINYEHGICTNACSLA